MIDIEQIIYFDNNSTTPIDQRVLDAMLPFLKQKFANSSSIHQFGISVNEYVKKARIQVADLIGAEANEIIFTSGATEAINIALKGVAYSHSSKGNNIITAATEHKAVLETCKYLESQGFEITYLPVYKDGLIKLNELKQALKDETILVCVMYVNNETGVIQQINEIARLAHARGALFMSDTTQAVGKIPVNVEELDVDIICMSGHKMYAPKGIGALYIRNSIKISTYIHGGGQEKNLRSGTLNVPSIIALGKACEIAQKEMNRDIIKIKELRDRLETELIKIPNTFVNGNKEKRIYNVTNICFKGVDASVLIGKMKNVAISIGSACNSSIEEPSHILTAMGLSFEDAFGSIRFSLGRFNTIHEIENVVQKFIALNSN